MLLYLMIDPTITAILPRIPITEAMAADAVTSVVSASENVFHSWHMGKQVEFSR